MPIELSVQMNNSSKEQPSKENSISKFNISKCVIYYHNVVKKNVFLYSTYINRNFDILIKGGECISKIQF